jgi:hypothetical protein
MTMVIVIRACCFVLLTIFVIPSYSGSPKKSDGNTALIESKKILRPLFEGRDVDKLTHQEQKQIQESKEGSIVYVNPIYASNLGKGGWFSSSTYPKRLHLSKVGASVYHGLVEVSPVTFTRKGEPLFGVKPHHVWVGPQEQPAVFYQPIRQRSAGKASD